MKMCSAGQHDLSKPGAVYPYRPSACVACNRRRMRETDELGLSLRRMWLPFDPLVPYESLVPGRFADGTWAKAGRFTADDVRLSRAWWRAKDAGRITVLMADEICIGLLQRHPSEIYGELWFREDVSA